MLLGAYLTTAFCIAATGAWYLLRRIHDVEAKIMLNMGLGLAAVLIPAQIVFGHLTGEYTAKHQPSKFTAIEGRWQTEQPARLLLFAWPDVENERNHCEIAVPYLGSFVDTGSFTSEEPGIVTIPKEQRPPFLIPFYSFRIMVGMGLLMLAMSWVGICFRVRGWDRAPKAFLWITFLSFPSGLHRHAHRLVHRRGRPPAVGGVRPAADGGRGDAQPRRDRGVDLADRLRHRLHADLLGRYLLHLPPAEGRAGASAAVAGGRRLGAAADVGVRTQPGGGDRPAAGPLRTAASRE